ncbi:MAG: hypothetical protein AAGE80_11100 [Pseudomonadota bacterium]
MTDQTSDLVTESLSRIEASGRLGTRSRLPKLLDFLVSEELEGRGDRISEYSIGIDALNRGDSFDPSSDSIVRTEMNRLRQALELYYGAEGASDPIKIEVPKGTYRPKITHRQTTNRSKAAHPIILGTIALLVACGVFAFIQSNPETRQASFDGPRLLVKPFAPIDPASRTRGLANGLTFELITDLTQYSWLAVSKLSTDVDPEGIAISEADFLLDGEVEVVDDQLVVTSSLAVYPNLDVVWTSRLERAFKPSDIIAAKREISFEIAKVLGNSRGIVPSLIVSHRAKLDDVTMESFSCLMDIHEYWESPTVELHKNMRECLLKAVDRDPLFAEAWAALAFIFIDEGREKLNPRPGFDAWVDADNAVERALEIAPLSSMVLNAAMTLEVARPKPDYAAFRAYGERELSLRPNSAFTLANFGAKTALNAGQWKEGMLLHARALELDKHPPNWFFFAPAYESLLFGSLNDFAEASARLGPRGSKPVELLRAISAAKTGDTSALSQSIELLKDDGIVSRELAKDYVRERRFTAELTSKLIGEIELLPEFSIEKLD